MIKLVSAVLLFLIAMTSQARIFDGYYVTKNNDTVQCQIKVRVNMFNNDLVDPLSYRKSISIIEKNGVKKRFKPFQIESLTIEHPNSEYSNIICIPISLNGRGWFVRAVDLGEINIYKMYYPDSYSAYRSLLVLQTESQEPKQITNPGFRKKVLNYLNNDPFFVEKFQDRAYKYDTLTDLVKEYNKANKKVN